MISRILIAGIIFALPFVAAAGDLQQEIKGQWLGAWVIVSTESYSDCSGMHTNNRVNGNLVKSSGNWRFKAGELAKLDKVDLKRSRLDVLLTLSEPVLVPSQDGPFTLYHEAECKVELEIEVPRQTVKAKDFSSVERLLSMVVERHATEDDALDSGAWNGREMEPFPADYESTLAAHAVWRAEQTNLAVELKIDHAQQETSRLADRLGDGPLYLAGFSQGVKEAKALDLRKCPTLMSVDLGQIRQQAARAKAKQPEIEAEWVQGFQDGKVLVYGLEMLRNLGDCFVPVPESEAVEISANR